VAWHLRLTLGDSSREHVNGVFLGAVMVSLLNEAAVLLSDRDLEHHMMMRLLDRSGAASRQIIIRADNGIVTIRGTVTSFYQKQLCIETCRGVPGIVNLIDELEVASIM
jgi:osmotically-inducible protein OsmY